MSVKPLHNESELLAKVARGNEHAFRLIYDRYHKKIYLFAFRILDSKTLAEEVMQETMLKLWLMGEELLKIQHLQNFLITTGCNKSISMLRKQKTEKKGHEELKHKWKEIHNETEEEIILNDTRQLIQQALALIPEHHRAVYELCYQEGLKYEEVAKRLNLSPLSVQTYMKLALRFIRQYISKHSNIAVLLIILNFPF